MAGMLYPTYQSAIFPAWPGDFFDADDLIPGGNKVDAAQFNVADAAVVTVGAAGALANATSVPVAALVNPIPLGTVLWFGGAKYVHLTAAAAAGATSLTVSALPTALVSGDVATYGGVGGTVDRKSLPSGYVVGRTYAERDAGTPYGPAADTDDEVYIVAFAIDDLSRDNDVTLVRPGDFVVKENLLPQAGTLSSAVLAKLRANYVCVIGKTT